MDVAIVHGTFSGLYEWGKGWVSSEASNAWNEFLENLNATYWHSVLVEDFDKTWYLVGTHGSVYLHPMDFNAVFHNCGVHSADDFSCEELEEICKELAQACGGTFELAVSKPLHINSDLVPYKKGIHNTIWG